MAFRLYRGIQIIFNLFDCGNSKSIIGGKKIDPYHVSVQQRFKIPNPGIYFKSATFISDDFKTLVEQNHLTGLKFSAAHEDEGGNLIWQDS